VAFGQGLCHHRAMRGLEQKPGAIEVRLRDAAQLFNSMDPSPFSERDRNDRKGEFIAGWAAMWRPMETFLFDWWPLRRECRFYERLARARVTVIVPKAK